MKFGIFYEHQLPRPWSEGVEQKLFNDALEQVEVADRLGIDFAWEVEHHFLEEILAFVGARGVPGGVFTTRTKNIRLGHGIRQVIPQYKPPGANGRGHCDPGLGLARPRRVSARVSRRRSSSSAASRSPWKTNARSFSNPSSRSATMLAMDPYPGYKGQYFEMPCRNNRAKAGAAPASAALGGVLAA